MYNTYLRHKLTSIYPWHTHTYPWHTHSYPWYTHTYPWHTHTYSWHTHTYSWHIHTYPWHTHTYPWHSTLGYSHSLLFNIYMMIRNTESFSYTLQWNNYNIHADLLINKLNSCISTKIKNNSNKRYNSYYVYVFATTKVGVNQIIIYVEKMLILYKFVIVQKSSTSVK